MRGRTISTLKWKNPRRIELDVATLLFSHAYAEFLFVFDEKHIGLIAIFATEPFASQIAELPGRELFVKLLGAEEEYLAEGERHVMGDLREGERRRIAAEEEIQDELLA